MVETLFTVPGAANCWSLEQSINELALRLRVRVSIIINFNFPVRPVLEERFACLLK